MSALAAILPLLAWAADPRYVLDGQLDPPTRALVELHGATSPYSASVLADDQGRFRFHKLAASSYTLVVRLRRRGELRQTLDVGPGTATRHNRVGLRITIDDSKLLAPEGRRGLVSVRQLSVPDKAHQEYAKAIEALQRRDVESATRHLERAVELAPQYNEAWNNLGTIAYQTRRFPRAEECFRRSLEARPDSYLPLVNLGGTLLTLGKTGEALRYNVEAVLRQPADALANSQLGMTYYAAGNLELARAYLAEAKRLDPAHFSQPQLVLAEIYARKGDRSAAAGELEDFLARHPDHPNAAQVRESIAKLRAH